jgi:hypothetical protein
MSTELNENQQLAVQLVASGMSGREVAKELKIRPETVSRWKNDPDFVAGVNTIIVDAQENCQAKLCQLSALATQIIEDALNDESVPTNIKLHAAFKLLAKVGEPKRELETNAKKIASLKMFDEIML